MGMKFIGSARLRRAAAVAGFALTLLASGLTGAHAAPLGGLGTAHVAPGAALLQPVACQGGACGQPSDEPAQPCRERYAERWGGNTRREIQYLPECGVRCMFDRMRNGFCGAGCDYYAYRMYEYEDGQIFNRRPCTR